MTPRMKLVWGAACVVCLSAAAGLAWWMLT
jgi:hypothetical protein